MNQRLKHALVNLGREVLRVIQDHADVAVERVGRRIGLDPQPCYECGQAVIPDDEETTSLEHSVASLQSQLEKERRDHQSSLRGLETATYAHQQAEKRAADLCGKVQVALLQIIDRAHTFEDTKAAVEAMWAIGTTQRNVRDLVERIRTGQFHQCRYTFTHAFGKEHQCQCARIDGHTGSHLYPTAGE